jgi:DNA-directed RNA polymerase subunit RPC12/RpoP
MRYKIRCEFCGRTFLVGVPPEPGVSYLCPRCTEEFRREA